MKYLFALILCTLCILLFSLVGLYTTGSKQYSIASRSRFLEVVNKDDQVVGYLFGSLHTSLEKEEIESTIDTVNGLLPTTKHLFLECIIGHWTAMQSGVEKAVLKAVENSDMDIKVKELETLSAQKAMLGGIFAVGSKVGRLPYGGFFIKYPGICSIINSLNNIIWFFPNAVYALLINPEFATQNAHKINNELTQFRKDFLNNVTSVATDEQVDLLQLVVRDRVMYQVLTKSVGEFSQDNLFIVIIGNLHLSLDSGIISHFEADGYTVRPMAIGE